MRKKDAIFSDPTSTPQKTAGMGPFGAVLLLSFVCWTEGWAWNTLWMKRKEEKQRETREEVSTEILWLKKENCRWLWNITRKKCVVAFVISFFYLMLLSLFIFGGSIFPRWRSVSSYLFLFSFCNLFDLLWLFTPFQMSIGEKKVLSQLVIPDPPSPAPLPFCPKCSRQEIWK